MQGIGVLATLALTAGLLPATAVAADARDTTVVCEDRRGNAGNDIAGHTHEDTIRCVAGYEIAEGYTDGTYRPNATITRGQMAAFIGRSLAVAGAVPAGIELHSGSFPDTPGTTHEAWIELLNELGVVQGRSDGTYGPGADVTRGQMAAFLTRMIDHAHNHGLDGSQPPAPTTSSFGDAKGTRFETEIEQLREAGIFLGDRDGNAKPGQAVTRGQMASFVTRTAAYLDDIRRWRPTYETLELEVAMSWHNVTDGEGEYRLGEEDAISIFAVVIDEIARKGAYAMQVDGVSTPYPTAPAFSLNRGTIDEVGPAALSLDVNDQLAFDDKADGQFDLAAVATNRSTAAIVELLDALVDDPDSFYIELRTVEFPNGVIRGQLPEGGQDQLPEEAGFPGQEEFDRLIDDLRDGLGLGDSGDDGLLDPITDPIAPILDPIPGPIIDPITDPIDPILGLL
jgi:hypothetical protein